MIPYGRQEITQDDIDAVIDVLKSDLITQGPIVPLFEKELCNFTNSDYAVVANSCTSALHIACLALGLGPGDLIWTSAISFVASANCGYYCGASVDFLDIDQNTGLINFELLESKLKIAKLEGNLPKIIIPVHFAGQSCDMKQLSKLGTEYNFKIIEDAAHAVGSTYLGSPVGCCQYSDITIFSFHPVKIITTGEGGAALTNDYDLAEKMKLLRSHGITRNKDQLNNSSMPNWYYEQICLGFNYRMTDIHASIGLSQLKRLSNYLIKRNEIALWYDKKLKKLPLTPLIQRNDNASSFHLYVVRVNGGEQIRNKLYEFLIENGISVNLHYIPIYRHPFFNRDLRLKGAEEFYKSALSLPIFPKIRKAELHKILKKIEYFFSE